MKHTSRFLKYAKYAAKDDTPELYEGQYILLMADFDGFKGVQCILTYKRGKLDGSPAITTTTGYTEKWENGFFKSSTPSFCTPIIQEPENRTTTEEQRASFARIRKEFEQFSKNPKQYFGETIAIAEFKKMIEKQS